MLTTEVLTELLGWSLLINIIVIIVAALGLIVMRSSIASIHGKMFGLDESDLSRAYFQYLAQYKIAIFVLNLTPYIALRIMGY